MNKLALLPTIILCLLLISCGGKNHQQKTSVVGESPNPKTISASQVISNEPANDDAPIHFRFYLERSGSMIAYDDRNTTGDFKTAITNLLNNIPNANSKTNMLYVVNSGVFPYDKTYKEFVRSADIFSDTKELGDPRYTDFTCIFDSLLRRTDDNVVSMLVSDLIYSTIEMKNKNVEKILNEAHDLTASVFKEQDDKDVLLIKLLSDYRGKYYVYNQPNIGIPYNGDRPYYIVIVAKHKDMVKLFRKEEYKEFRNFEKLERYQNYYLFAATDATAPYYSILASDSKNKGTRMKSIKGQGHEIHSISDVKPNRNGDIYITMAIDLSMVFMSNDTKLDPSNYLIKSKSNFEIAEILPIPTDEKKSVLTQKYLSTSTHYLILHTTKEKFKRIDEITIEMPNKIPEWVAESTSSDDRHPNPRSTNFSETTFALYELCSGIYDAYYGNTEVPNYFKLNLYLKK